MQSKTVKPCGQRWAFRS